MNPKISVITVCYNAAATIEMTVRSVLSQTYENIEYIIIDGGSNDGTQDIIERIIQEPSQTTSNHLKPHQTKLKWFSSEPDKGIYDAMNKGLAHAEGDWASFMNAGDTFADEKVLDDIFGTQESISKEYRVIAGKTINVLNNAEELYSPAKPEALEREMMCSHQALFVRLSPEEPWRFDTKYRIAADYNLLHTIYKAHGANAFLLIDRAVARYDCTESFSLSSKKAAKREYLRIQCAWTKFWWWNEWKRLLFGIYK